MAQFAIISNEVSYAADVKFFAAKNGFVFGADLVALDQAKTFRSIESAEKFLASMKAAGFKSFRVAKV